VVDGQPVPVADIGGVAFDVADRLAIINLFGAYAYAYDQNRLDDFRALFTESPELGLRLHDGNQRRHALNSFWFDTKAPRRRPAAVMSRYSRSATAAHPRPTSRAATSSPRSSRTACGDAAAGS
jgi:hypothetical protein